MGDTNKDIVTVIDVAKKMQHFDWPDYLVAVIICLVYISVGIYYSVYKKSETTQDYFVGGRTMTAFPIAMSIIATYFSGISMLGVPTEVYVYGIQFMYTLGGFMVMAIPFQYVFLPIIYDLKITSVFEYLERRFDWKVRLMGSLMFFSTTLAWLSIVIYVPALAFNQVTGININYVIPISAIICIFYTTTGGLRAVVSSDVIQTILVVSAMIFLTIKGTIDVGGLNIVFSRNWESGRIESPSFDPNPLTRHTLWCLALGGSISWLNSCGISQNVMQRYISVSTFNEAKRALWICMVGLSLILIMCGYLGMLIYATYYNCDPLTTKLAKQRDQILLVLVMDVVGSYPGLTGLFLSGIFSAALSSLSTGLNSMAAVIIEDYYTLIFKKKLTSRKSYIIMKTSVVVLGSICLGLSFIMEFLGSTIMQFSNSISSIIVGPICAVFTMGVLLPWINSTGALIGTVSSLIVGSWICFHAQVAIAKGEIDFETKPTNTDGCHYNFTPNFYLNKTVSNFSDVFPLYRLSYQWYATVGFLVSIIVALIVNIIITPRKSLDTKPELVATFMRRFLDPTQEQEEASNMKLLNNMKKVENIPI